MHGDLGQEVILRVTKDTNMICAGGKGSQMSTGREGAKEPQEIPPTPHMEKQTKQGKGSGGAVRGPFKGSEQTEGCRGLN